MRKTIITAAAAILLLGALPVRADEGMWLPCLISHRIEDMQDANHDEIMESISDVWRG